MFKTIKKKIRIFKKDLKSDIKCYGFIGGLWEQLPCRIRFRVSGFIWAIRHRTINKYHVIKTDLKPSYYEIETLMVHGLFSLLVRFVEEEHKGVNDLQDYIMFLKKSKKDDENIPEEQRYDYDYDIQSHQEALRLYHWWKFIYPKYEENDPWEKYYNENPKAFDLDNVFEVAEVDEDGDPKLYRMINKDTPEEKIKNRMMFDDSAKYQKMIADETENNMIALIKIRGRLWT